MKRLIVGLETARVGESSLSQQAVASEVMTKRVITARPDHTLLQVSELMETHGISRVVIQDENRAVGIVTQKDLLAFLLDDVSPRGMEEMKASEAMTTGLITAEPTTPVQEVAKKMIWRDISSVIIVDTEGLLAGIVTKFDLTMHCAKRWVGIHKVRDFMTPNPVTVKPTQSVFSVVSTMREKDIARVLVADKTLQGIITLADLSSAGDIFAPAKLIRERKAVSVKGLIVPATSIITLTARDIMTPNPKTAREDEDLCEAAGMMARNRFGGLPVVNVRDELVGIITETDIAKALASPARQPHG